MDICKHPGCGSAALNDRPESGLCDKCYWREQAKKLRARVEGLEGKCDGLAGRNKKLAAMCKQQQKQINRQKALLKTKPEAGLKAIADALREPLDCGHPAGGWDSEKEACGWCEERDALRARVEELEEHAAELDESIEFHRGLKDKLKQQNGKLRAKLKKIKQIAEQHNFGSVEGLVKIKEIIDGILPGQWIC